MHIPNTKDRLCDAIIVSDKIHSQSVKTLSKMGIEVIFAFENRNVSPALSKHVDLQLVKIDENKFLSAPECFEYYKPILSEYGYDIEEGNTYLSSNYPSDIAYNIIIGEKYAVGNFKYADAMLMKHIKDKSLINVNQGYSRCTVCSVGDFAYITPDSGVCKKLSEYEDINVLQICQGKIELDGYKYGFIGGATFMIGKNTLAINGDIYSHPDGADIIDFCKGFGVDIVSLSSDMIADIGSAISLVRR